MYTMEEFCYIMDSKKPDILDQLQKGNFINESVKTVDDMTAPEKKVYHGRTKGQLYKYHKMKNWRKLLG